MPKAAKKTENKHPKAVSERTVSLALSSMEDARQEYERAVRRYALAYEEIRLATKERSRSLAVYNHRSTTYCKLRDKYREQAPVKVQEQRNK